ncbi:hypothetical protein M8J76_005449 [Diaphorina citri]|nr:hypothetical protein M8J76_005449 [Diaphorina citri]
MEGTSTICGVTHWEFFFKLGHAAEASGFTLRFGGGSAKFRRARPYRQSREILSLFCSTISTQLTLIILFTQNNNQHEPASSLDEEVKELERLKPTSNEGQQDQNMPISQSVSMVKSHSSVYSNINGKVEGKAETKQELNKNGETYAKIRQNVEAKSVDNSPTPETNIITAVDIPSQGIHKVYRQRHPGDTTGNNLLNVLNILEPLHPKRNVEYSSVLDQAPVVSEI